MVARGQRWQEEWFNEDEDLWVARRDFLLYFCMMFESRNMAEADLRERFGRVSRRGQESRQ